MTHVLKVQNKEGLILFRDIFGPGVIKKTVEKIPNYIQIASILPWNIYIDSWTMLPISLLTVHYLILSEVMIFEVK